MLNLIRKVGSVVAGCVITGALLSGCGGGGSQPTKSAASEIKAARSALEEGRYALNANRFDEAKGHFETARSKIVAGKVIATMVEKGKLDELSTEVNDALATIDIKQKDFQNKEKLRKEKEEREKQIAALNQKTGESKSGDKTSAEDKLKAEAKKKEEEEKLKKEQEEARLKAMSTASKKDNSKTAEEEGDTHAETKTVDGKTVEAAGGEEKAAPKGPYRAYGENPPKMSVDAVNAKGEYMFCYVQLFNKGDADKRIGKVDGTFRDAGNGVIDDAIGCYHFDFFARDIADPTEQNNAKAALTGGSHVIPAHGSIMLVLVGKHRNAAKAKKCAVTASYEDGSSDSDSGPGSVSQDAEKPAIPGLK